jgi:hypothetical protein
MVLLLGHYQAHSPDHYGALSGSIAIPATKALFELLRLVVAMNRLLGFLGSATPADQITAAEAATAYGAPATGACGIVYRVVV